MWAWTLSVEAEPKASGRTGGVTQSPAEWASSDMSLGAGALVGAGPWWGRGQDAVEGDQGGGTGNCAGPLGLCH